MQEKRPYTAVIFQYPIFNKKGKLTVFEEVYARVRHSKTSDMQTLVPSLWSSVVSFCAEMCLPLFEAMKPCVPWLEYAGQKNQPGVGSGGPMRPAHPVYAVRKK